MSPFVHFGVIPKLGIMTPIRRHILGPLPKKGLGSVLPLSRTFDADLRTGL